MFKDCKYTCLFFALAALICISCSKESAIGEPVSGGPEPIVSAVIDAPGTTTTSGTTVPATKVAFLEDGATRALKAFWEAGDKVIGFDSNGVTYGYEVESKSVQSGTARLTRITSGDFQGTATASPAEGTTMYLFYAPGSSPANIGGNSLTCSLASQSKDIVPAFMMAQAKVEGNVLVFHFRNVTSVLGIKNPTMAVADRHYSSIELTGTAPGTGTASCLNTRVCFSLNGGDLAVSYDTPGPIAKKVDFTSSPVRTVSGVIYIASCPLATATDLTFTADSLERFRATGRTMEAGGYYYMTPTFEPSPSAP